MCSDRYADERPFLFLNSQLPPTSSLISKQSNGTPLSLSALAMDNPLMPAPTMQALGNRDIPDLRLELIQEWIPLEFEEAGRRPLRPASRARQLVRPLSH